MSEWPFEGKTYWAELMVVPWDYSHHDFMQGKMPPSEVYEFMIGVNGSVSMQKPGVIEPRIHIPGTMMDPARTEALLKELFGIKEKIEDR